MPPSRPTLYLIDASSYVYRAFFALPPLSNAAGSPTNALFGLTTMLLKLLRETKPEYLAAVFDAKGPTFRDDLFDSYKANRPSMPDDLAAQMPLVPELIEAFAIRSLSMAGVEADDVIGSLATRMESNGVDVVVITGDKDLMQLVSEHIRLWDTMRDRWYDVAAVRQRWGVDPERVVDIMGLMGDAIDNIPGVKGIGEKTALALIQRFGTVDEVLARLDELATLTDIRGAKKLAVTLRAEADTARLSRQLAVVRRDLEIGNPLDDFRCVPLQSDALRPIFTRLGFQSLLKDLTASAPPVSVPVVRATGPEDVARLAAAARAHGRLALACDVIDGQPEVAGVVVATAGVDPLYVPVPSGTAERAAVTALLEDSQIEKVGHDLKRDLLRLGTPGHALVSPTFDVMVASYVLEASATHRLEDLATDTVGVQLGAFRGDAASLTNGVSVLLDVRDRLAPRLRDYGMERLFYDMEMPLVSVLARMEARGVRLDVAALQAMSQEMETRLTVLEQEIYQLAGGAFNIASPPQLREVLFDRLSLSRKGVKRGKTGLSTDVDVLTRLAATHPLPGKILEHRGLAKLKSTYLDALPAAVNPRTGRLHTSFNQTVAATGRLSSSDPNLQNIPIRTEEGRRIRATFVADEGNVLVVADYSQIELRLLAHLSSDPSLLAAFRAGDDVHTRTAAEVFGILPGAITADMRRAAKVINFGIIYGMGPQRLARELSIPMSEAEQYIASYFQRYAGVRAYIDTTCREARARGYVTTLLGRRRGMPDLASRDRGVAQAAERTAANTPIQGSAADLIKLAMVSIDRRIRDEALDISMILQVHDELVFEVPAAQSEMASALVREEMEGVFPLQVPLRVDLGIGRNWAEAH